MRYTHGSEKNWENIAFSYILKEEIEFIDCVFSVKERTGSSVSLEFSF